jgi:hypothetical protein
MGLVRERSNFTPVIGLQLWYPLIAVENNLILLFVWGKITR